MSKRTQMEKVLEDVKNLTRSPFYEERVLNGYVPVIGEGSLDAQIMLVGEAPGKNEALTGKPFCGASGKVLDQLLEHVGIRREDVYVTSIVKDRPAGNRDPKPEEISLYAPFLLRQFEIIRPKVIATLGRFSMRFVMDHFGLGGELQAISALHGKVFKVTADYGDLIIIPLYHPAVAVYSRTRISELKEDMETVERHARHLPLFK